MSKQIDTTYHHELQFNSKDWHGRTECVFCHHDEIIKHLCFQSKFVRSIGSTIQVASTLYPPLIIDNIFGNWLHGVDHMFRDLIRIRCLPLLGCFAYVRMTMF
jgi:hypothetical protein